MSRTSIQGRLRAPPARSLLDGKPLGRLSGTLRGCQRIARMHLAKVVCQVQQIA